MDLPSQEVDIPVPLNSAYAGAHVHVTNMTLQHHDHVHVHDHHHEPSPNKLQVPSSNGPPMSMTQNPENHHYRHHHHHDHVLLSNNKKQGGGGGGGQVRYRECLRNHAASMGGNATDGCGEFMPSGEEGTIEALTCSACNCHRNFHRKEIEGEISASPLLHDCYLNPPPSNLMMNSRGRKVINFGHHKNILSPSEAFGVGGYTTPTASALVSQGGGARSVPMIPYTMGPLLIASDQSDDQDEEGAAASARVACRGLSPHPPPPPSHLHQYHHSHRHNQMLKKRFRTKFTPEQKEKMLNFAEKVGWKIQNQEESVVQQFCQEIGVKRRVLKVWMHNNKHNLAKKNSFTSNA